MKRKSVPTGHDSKRHKGHAKERVAGFAAPRKQSGASKRKSVPTGHSGTKRTKR